MSIHRQGLSATLNTSSMLLKAFCVMLKSQDVTGVNIGKERFTLDNIEYCSNKIEEYLVKIKNNEEFD